MVGAISRESYFETGLDVLSDVGYGGLKLAEVCRRLGVTTGSFYHYFASWSEFTRGLIAYWDHLRGGRSPEGIHADVDPRQRIDILIQEGLGLRHGAESAIRVWSSLDPYVHAVQSAVDQRRFDVLSAAAFNVLGDERQSHVFAYWALYLLIGYEQSTLPRDADDLKWIAAQLLDALDSGRFDSVSDAG